eukprot:PhF_6_TR22293/c0_g1_i1/m.31544
MASPQVVTLPILCTRCGVQLFPPVDVTLPAEYYECLQDTCETFLCRSCAAPHALPMIHTTTSSQSDRMGKPTLVCDIGEIMERAATADDVEPNELAPELTCIGCGGLGCMSVRYREEVVHVPFRPEEMCCHCGCPPNTLNLAKGTIGCMAVHEGSHDLPVDQFGCPTYKMMLIDIGGMYHISSVHQYPHPGRWRCCGQICYHTTPACPLYHVARNFSNSSTVRVEDLRGCVKGLSHTRTASEQTSSLDPFPPCSVQTGTVGPGGKGTIENPNWRKQVPFNTKPPVDYPGGHPLFPGVEYDPITYT